MQRVFVFSTMALAALVGGCSSETSSTNVPGTGTPTGTASGTTTTTDLTFTTTGDTGTDTTGPLPCEAVDFPLSETQEQLVVPADARYMQVKAWGAGGNGEGQCTAPMDDAGIGGFTGGVFSVQAGGLVEPGATLVVIVGQRGRAGLDNEDVVRFGFGHWGGGGLSGVFLGPDLISATDQSKALIVAGGGGGATAPGCMPAGTGNHPDAGGMTGTMMGGEGADEVNGGAGGYVGGLGGVHLEPGHGGTGFVHAEAIDPVLDYSEPGTAVAPRNDDADYADNAGTDEQPGRVVIHFACDLPPPI